MNTQPEALRLADILQHKLPSIECLEIAAAELRRLHEANQAMLEALKLIAGQTYDPWTNYAEAQRYARAAIAKGEQQ
jgi:hypothetical protein